MTQTAFLYFEIAAGMNVVSYIMLGVECGANLRYFFNGSKFLLAQWARVFLFTPLNDTIKAERVRLDS